MCDVGVHHFHLVSNRVKRLGCFDHAERQLGERCLYVFPEKVEPAKITCECPERNCVLGEGTVAKKVCIVEFSVWPRIGINDF